MEDKSLLIFSQHGSFYGIDAPLVKELLLLPELTPAPESPDYIAGIFNLRGKIVPVMNLDVRAGRSPQPYQLSDSVIILEGQEMLWGLIVNQVYEVQPIATTEIEAAPTYAQDKTGETLVHFIAGVAKSEMGLIMLLDLEKLWWQFEETEPLIAGQPGVLPAGQRLFCPEATPAARAIYEERAQSYSQPITSQDFAGLAPLAVVSLGGEYFGVNLEIVREFAEIQTITPIPCCPPHIVGDMNLRGDILTIVDIRGVLRMPVTAVAPTAKVIVVHVDDLFVGVPVDEVLEVIYRRPSDMTAAPAVVHSAGDEYIRGVAPYDRKMLTVLDLLKILTSGDLIVNEEV